ncbi:efflux RND transporter periplasmic adaptor subunit [Patescibacteria group bacterium]|nr:efflux RND transporter periplasmic adaptor subunit [Patescibacteria group bacterium]
MSQGKTFKGRVVAETIEVRFAFSGKVAKVHKNPGDKVKAGERLAALGTKMLQAELDKELADYERARAEFEIFKIKSRDSTTDVEKYEKTRKQGFLDAAVKQVEIAKYRLDRTQLSSPVAGIVLENSGLRPGMFITPGSYGIEILDLHSLHLRIEVAWSEIGRFPQGAEVKMKIEGKEEELTGKILPLLPYPKKGKGLIRIKLQGIDGIWPGMEGEVKFS